MTNSWNPAITQVYDNICLQFTFLHTHSFYTVIRFLMLHVTDSFFSSTPVLLQHRGVCCWWSEFFLTLSRIRTSNKLTLSSADSLPFSSTSGSLWTYSSLSRMRTSAVNCNWMISPGVLPSLRVASPILAWKENNEL